MLKVTTLLENSTVRHNLLSQHGQSLLIELNGRKVLFDVGEVYEGFTYNLGQFGLSIDDIDAIIISHRHIDHIGALEKILPHLSAQKLYLPTQLGTADIKEDGPKYVFLEKKNGNYDVAASNLLARKLTEYEHTEICEQEKEIFPNLWTTGCIGKGMEEQALVYDQGELGLTVMVGCSHPGLESIITKAQDITGNTKIRCLIGGFHFNKMSEAEVKQEADYLNTLKIEYLLPNHCTGILQTTWLKKYLPDSTKLSKTYSVGTGNAVSIAEKITFDVI
jgi:7,8-dihydropterin-6-yl-methyl-4-(beta-D-ribofuranosyl)aminobenzene 5'-phosphate synthase